MLRPPHQSGPGPAGADSLHDESYDSWSGWSMIDCLDAPRDGGLKAPTIWVALGLSLLIHLALLWVWPQQLHWLSLENSERGDASGPLVVELAREASEKEAVTAPTVATAPSARAPQRRASRSDRAAALEPARSPLTPP